MTLSYDTIIFFAFFFAELKANRPWTSSFRMTLFPLARSVTNRRAAGAVDIFQHSEFILFKQILQQIDGSAARHSVSSVYSVDFK